MAQVKKLQSGGDVYTRDKITFDKDSFNSALQTHVDDYAVTYHLDDQSYYKLKQDVQNFANGSADSSDPVFQKYLDFVTIHGGANVYSSAKKNYDGNNYLLQYIMKDYNGNLDLFEKDWESKDEVSRYADLAIYLGKAIEDANNQYHKYDFSKSNYTDVSKFTEGLKKLQKAIGDTEISEDDRRLAYSLGIDLDTWISPVKKENASSQTSTTDNYRKQLEDKVNSEHPTWTDEQKKNYIDTELARHEQSESEAYDAWQQSVLDQNLMNDYTKYINDRLSKINDFNSNVPQLTYNQKVVSGLMAQDDIDRKNGKLEGSRNYRKNFIKKFFAENKGYNQTVLDYAEYFAQTGGNSFIAGSFYTSPYVVWVYNKDLHRFLLIPVFDEGLNNFADIEEYREKARNSYTSLRQGGVIKAQTGVQITSPYQDWLNRPESEQQYDYEHWLNRSEEEEPVTEEELTNQDFDGSDIAHIVAAGGDIAALAASFVPGGAPASLLAGIGSAIIDTGADFADVVSGEMSIGKALMNTAVNVGSAFLGMIPGGQTAKVLNKVGKYIPRIMATLGAMQVAPNILKAFDDFQKGKDLSKDEWMSIVQGIRLLTLGIRDLRGIHLNNKYSTGKLEIGISNGKSVKLNPNEAAEYSKLANDAERNQWLKARNKIKEDESVTRSLFGLRRDEKYLSKEFMTPMQAARAGYSPSSSSYRYIYTINSGFKNRPVRTNKASTTAESAPTQSTAENSSEINIPAGRLSGTTRPIYDAGRDLHGANRRIQPAPGKTEMQLQQPVAKDGRYNLFPDQNMPKVQVRPYTGSTRGFKKGGEVKKYDGGGQSSLFGESIYDESIFDKLYKENTNKYSNQYFNNYVSNHTKENSLNLGNVNTNDLPFLKKYTFNTSIDVPEHNDTIGVQSAYKKSKEQLKQEYEEAQEKTKQARIEAYKALYKDDRSVVGTDFKNYIDAIKNIDSEADPYRMLENYLRDDSVKQLNLTNDAIRKLADQQVGYNATPYRTTAAMTDIYRLDANKLFAHTKDYYKNRTSNAEAERAGRLENSKANIKSDIQYDTLISKGISENNAAQVTSDNKNAQILAQTATANSQIAAALKNARTQADMQHEYNRNNIYQGLNTELRDRLNKDHMERNDKITKYLNAQLQWNLSKATYDKYKELSQQRASKISERYATRHAEDSTYTMDQAAKEVDKELEWELHELNEMGKKAELGYLQGVLGIPEGYRPVVPFGRHQIYDPWTPPINGYKKGGSLTLSERKDLEQQQFLLDDVKTTQLLNFKAYKEAQKIFNNGSNNITKEIYKLINKAVGI